MEETIIKLSQKEIDKVKNEARNNPEDPHSAALSLLWRIIEPNFDNMDKVDPTQYIMERSQVTDLMNYCIKVQGQTLGSPMAWVNIGPSSR
jgi:hypothetical protein